MGVDLPRHLPLVHVLFFSTNIGVLMEVAKEPSATANLYCRAGIWYFRAQVRGREIRKSLHTDDYEEALRRAPIMAARPIAETTGALRPRQFLEAVRERGKPRQFVYFIREPDAAVVKIGFSCRPTARLRQMQVGSGTRLEIMAAFPARYLAEGALHKRFADARVHGEWFRLTPRLRRFIALVQSQGFDLLHLESLGKISVAVPMVA